MTEGRRHGAFIFLWSHLKPYSKSLHGLAQSLILALHLKKSPRISELRKPKHLILYTYKRAERLSPLNTTNSRDKKIKGGMFCSKIFSNVKYFTCTTPTTHKRRLETQPPMNSYRHCITMSGRSARE